MGRKHEAHGMNGTKPYMVWQAMKQRCDRRTHPRYADYGGRGISYDLRWSQFSAFWADMRTGYRLGITLDRIEMRLQHRV